MRYKKLNEISKSFKNELNQLYKDMDHQIILQGLNIANLPNTSQAKIAITDKIVSLRFTSVENELKKLGKTKEQISNIESNLYDFVSKFYIDRFSNLLKQIKNEDILTPFEMALLEGIHNIGIAITNMQKIWHKHIICDINKEFESKFDTIGDAMKFIDDNCLYQNDTYKNKCDRVYGAVIKSKNGYKMVPYMEAFSNECQAVVDEFIKAIDILNPLANSKEDKNYINYLNRLKEAFAEKI